LKKKRNMNLSRLSGSTLLGNSDMKLTGTKQESKKTKFQYPNSQYFLNFDKLGDFIKSA